MQGKKDEKKFSESFTLLCEVFDKQITPTLTEIYFQSLEEFIINKVLGGVSVAIKSCKFFPKPVELIEIINGGSSIQMLEDKSQVEAVKVLNAVKRVGGYNSVDFSDPVTKAVVMRVFGGWNKLCDDLLEKNTKWFLRDFSEFYRNFARSGVDYQGHLPGHAEIYNTEKGFGHIDVPVMIDLKDTKLLEDSDD